MSKFTAELRLKYYYNITFHYLPKMKGDIIQLEQRTNKKNVYFQHLQYLKDQINASGLVPCQGVNKSNSPDSKKKSNMYQLCDMQ